MNTSAFYHINSDTSNDFRVNYRYTKHTIHARYISLYIIWKNMIGFMNDRIGYTHDRTAYTHDRIRLTHDRIG